MTQSTYPHMAEPLRIGPCTLKNRTLMAPMESNLAAQDGTVSSGQHAYYVARAKGGVGMVIVEYTCVDAPGGLGGSPQLRLDEDRHIDSHAKLAAAIQKAGSLACVQLFHAGRQTHPNFTEGMQPIAASPIPCPMYRKMPREMTIADMDRVVDGFAGAARRAAQAGYDAVELHGTHGYLIANFLSAASNRRTDEFGGSLENRQRFPLRIVQAVREAAPDIALIVRMTAEEFVTGGTDIAEAVDTAKRLEQAGADALHVSTGCHERVDRNVDPVWMPEGWRLPLARKIRDVVGIPVIGVGVVRHPEVAEAAIADGSADAIALGRALLADPDWTDKALSGKAQEIRPCTSCNWCVMQIGTGHTPVGCAENPLTGHETEPPVLRSGSGEPAVVVGGGPGGITAALLLDQAGYGVTLFEAAPELAPGLVASAAAPKKDKFLWYRDYLLHRLEGSDVELRLGTGVDGETRFDTPPVLTVVATGSRDRDLDAVPGLDLPHVVSGYDLLAGRCDLSDGPIVIYGTGEIGCEVAKFAADQGREVILATRSDDDQAISRSNHLRIFREQFVETLRAYPNIRIELGAELRAIRADTVEFDCKGKPQIWSAAQVVLAIGRLPESSVAAALQERGLNVEVIGDASEVRRIGDAVHDAYRAVRDYTHQQNPTGAELASLPI